MLEVGRITYFEVPVALVWNVFLIKKKMKNFKRLYCGVVILSIDYNIMLLQNFDRKHDINLLRVFFVSF